MSESYYVQQILAYLQNNLNREDMTYLFGLLDTIMGIIDDINTAVGEGLTFLSEIGGYLYDIRYLVTFGLLFFVAFHFVSKRWFYS